MTGIFLFDLVVRTNGDWRDAAINRVDVTLTCTGMYVCGLVASLCLI